jgi:hypothetical protein
MDLSEQELEERRGAHRQPSNPFAAEFPSRTWEREAPLPEARPARVSRRRASATLDDRPVRRLLQFSRLRSGMTLAILLLTVALVIAVLVVTGELKVSLAP